MKPLHIKIALAAVAVIAVLILMPRGMRFWQDEATRCGVRAFDESAWNFVGCDKHVVNPEKLKDADVAEAARYHDAAANGDADAQYKLGVLLRTTEDTEREGADWLMKSAKQGNVAAETEIGRIYENGEPGYTKDQMEAYYWFSLAALGGNKDAEAERDKITDWLTPEQVDAAKQRVKDSKP